MRDAFLSRVRQAIADPILQGALDRNAYKQQHSRQQAMASLPDPADLRQQARAIRQLALDRLDAHLGTFTRRLEEQGVTVHNASTAEDACRIVVDIVQRHGAETVVKSKSMVTEEIRLNEALAAAGLRAVPSLLFRQVCSRNVHGKRRRARPLSSFFLRCLLTPSSRPRFLLV